MGLTWGTPNGGNSASTGHKNKNNNASANKQTSNYSGGGGHPSAGGYATYAAPAYTAPASPHEDNVQANVTAPVNTTTTKKSGGNTTTTNNNYTENDYQDDWIKTWADSFNDNATNTFGAMTQSLNDSNKQNKDNFDSNYKLINENKGSIGDNLKSTGGRLDGLDGDYQDLFGDIGDVSDDVSDVSDSVDATNKDVGNLELDFSSLGKDLEGLDDIQKKYGLKLTDQDGNIVDINKDIIANEKARTQGQAADQNARNSQDAAVEKALEDVDYQLGDATKARSELEQTTNSSFQLADDAIAALNTDLSDFGLDMDNVTLGIKDDVQTYVNDSEIARDQLKKAINVATDGKFTTIKDYITAVENNEVEVNDHIRDLMRRYDSAQTQSLETSNIEQGKADQSILDTMDKYNTDQTRNIESNTVAIGEGEQKANSIISDTYTARKALLEQIRKESGDNSTTIKDYVDSLDQSGKESSAEIVKLMEAYDAAQTKALGESNTANQNANDAQDETAEDKDQYDQKYWSNRLKTLKDSGLSEGDVQKQLRQEMSILKDKSYSGDTVLTEEDHITAWADLNSSMYDLGIIDAGPAAPKEYMYETFLDNIDEWVKSGKVTVETTTSGMFDENTTNVYTLPNGQQVITKGSSPMFTDEDGEEFRFGNDTITLYMDGVELGSRDGDITTVTKQGEANHVDSSVNIGDDTNPNSAGNRSDGGNGGGNQTATPVQEAVAEPEEEDGPVVGEDIPLPNDLTDPDGDGAYGQNGQPFSLDGVTFWKRIKDRSGRWTYKRLDSYQNNGTSSRRESWGKNVQNF